MTQKRLPMVMYKKNNATPPSVTPAAICNISIKHSRKNKDDGVRARPTHGRINDFDRRSGERIENIEPARRVEDRNLEKLSAGIDVDVDLRGLAYVGVGNKEVIRRDRSAQYLDSSRSACSLNPIFALLSSASSQEKKRNACD